ncbi:MAG: LPS export ABC transporter periplasmic protein LptC [Candidatus Omnitrophota bacterium]|nr:LPS export ABC transporter periplasmic protein LptC [Candidatus Omnitrophota bacterium]
MIRKLIVACVGFVAFYIGFVWLQVFVAKKEAGTVKVEQSVARESTHKVFLFQFTKYTTDGKKEIEIEGDSADIFAKTVDLMNVVAKAYAEEMPVTLTSDRGNYDKGENVVHLTENVVVTTEDGARLLTEKLDIDPTEHTMETDVSAKVKKNNIHVEGMGARGDSQLKKVKFKKNVTVVVQDDNLEGNETTVITCDGPLVIDYKKNIAHFKDNVVAEDSRGKLTADTMDVYYNKVTRNVSKIVALGNVIIENPDGNKTFSDSAIYLADQGRIILGGDTEVIYFEGDGSEIGGEVL